MKPILIYFFVTLQLLLIHSYQDAQDAGNPYSSDPKVKHSLFLDKNMWNRISGGEQGVPMKNRFVLLLN